MNSLKELADEAYEINRANGWQIVGPDDWRNNDFSIPGVLMGVQSELTEAYEGYRNDSQISFAGGLGDMIIRILAISKGMGIDIEAVVRAKLELNKNIGYRNGGKRV